MNSNRHTIAVFTTTRAEYGLYYPLLQEISQSEELNYLLFVGGTHLATEHGKTINEILSNPEIRITDVFDFILNDDSSQVLGHSLAIETIQLSYLFQKYSFDFVMVLGDRIELLPIIENAIIFKKPIIHLHGGEKTHGAIDEQVRNMISKAAHIHFVSCTEYAKNLELMGESLERIHVVGALSIDNMVKINRIEKQQIFFDLNLDPQQPTVILSYHPVTLEMQEDARKQIVNIFNALECFDFQVIITSPNIDPGYQPIIDEIKKQLALHPNYRYIESLGMVRFHSILPHCLMIIGNSSSGIIEAPYYKIPTVNIGNRQKGRLRHQSIIDVEYNTEEIKNGIEKALDQNFRNSIQNMSYLFGDGNTAKKIVNILKKISINEQLLQK